ncbi:MAG: ABC transporter substrate-binding protein [Acidobacteriota bacterium]|nr:ABC transporter substrate-binding protein [Acidobacteriota bacterium]
MNRSTVAGLAVASAVALMATACSSGSKTPAASSGPNTSAATAAGSSPTPDVTIDVESNTLAGPITGGFNPFLTSEDAYGLGAVSMIYEPLLQFNILQPGLTRPWLASSYKWSTDGKTLTFNLRPGVKWSDGTPFTSADVVYTYNLMKQDTALNTNGISFESVSAPDPETVVMTFAAPAYTQLYAVAGQTLIVPQSKWSAVSDPATYPDTSPVGTGPYTLASIDSQSITLTRNPNYWQPGKPAIKTVVFPDYESNTSAASALQAGQLTWGGNFISHIQQIFANTPSHVFYSPPNNTVALWPNLTAWPTNQLPVRQAISLVLDRAQVSQQGEQGDEAPATSNTGLILPNDQSYLASSANTLPHDPAQATSILQGAGYKLVNGTWTSSDGKPVTINLEDPASYSDYMASDQAIANQLSSFGIKTSVNGVSVNAWNADLQSGHFQMTLHWGQTADTPYGQFQNWLDPSLIGGSAGNFERFNDPAATAALQAYASAGSDTAAKAAVTQLGNIVAQQLPIIPVMYGAAWGEYNSSKVTGFPTQSNPYDPAQPSVPFNEYVILQLHPVG